MSNSYRIRTKPGVDSSLRVLIDQEFEYLEILSLKILQSQIYTRQCSDYGVVVGRVSVNNGFGIPNAKVSIFIPLDSEDEINPVIADLYPYKTLSDVNEDGYRYNLLPYQRQHSGHNATGTFFTREDVLTNPTLIQVYDKYFKYTAVTNDSGDFMIFGVPVGAQTVVVDIDLSDIGEFSLSPQDLIRMGVATESQVAGVNFKSSTNLRELPQIINIVRNIEVEPLWGQPEICNLGITRTDFDLSGEANIDIRPTAIFMGSLISSNDDSYIKRNCKPRPKSGSLCELVAGPGEILAIRQTINIDVDGRPILETVDLEQGGQVIDDNGTWLVDLPMNMNYVTTNEFGEQVISSDPKVGVPTTGKYRFKVKWNQSPSLSADPVKRGYFLTPNIKEYGWDSGTDPIQNPSNSNDYIAAQKSYAFSLDWNDYGDTGTTVGQQMIQEAINCEDKFYEFQYNKVYSVSQLITQYRKGYRPSRIIAIKDILNSECESDNNKFPTNDGVLQFDLIYLLFTIMMFLFRPILYTLLVTTHVLAFTLLLLTPVLIFVAIVVVAIIIIICYVVWVIIWVIDWFASVSGPDCAGLAADMGGIVDKIANLYKLFTNLQIPVLSYPECEFCSCDVGQATEMPTAEEAGTAQANQQLEDSGAYSVLTPFEVSSEFDASGINTTNANAYQAIFAGAAQGQANSSSNPYVPQTRAPQIRNFSNQGNSSADLESIATTSITLAERLNLFNNKSKYFENDIINNPGGGVNRIQVSFNTSQINTYHQDNVVVLMVQTNNASVFEAGTTITFQDPSKSTDVNLTGYTDLNVYGTSSITGSTVNNTGNNIVVSYADPSNPNNPALTQTYISTQDSSDALYARFPMDVEYFQVITGMTYSSFSGMCSTSPTMDSLNNRFLANSMRLYKFTRSGGGSIWNPYVINYSQQYPIPMQYFPDYGNQQIVFLVRGVDPNTTPSNCEYDLSKIFGYSSYGTVKVKTGVNGAPQYKLNIPIQPKYKNVSHILTNSTSVDPYSGNKLYYESYHFEPAPSSNVAGFSSFTSNLVSYYSQMDNNNSGFKPSTSSPTLLSSNGFTFAGNGVQVKSTNSFTKEFPTISYSAPNYQFNASTSVSPVKGYYPGEIVEGGSAMYTNLFPDINSFNSNPSSLYSSGQWTSIYYAPKYSSGTTLNYNTLGSNNRQIVMRSDRLPTSTTTQDNLLNSFALHSNVKFSVFTVGNDGLAVPAGGEMFPPAGIPGAGADVNQDNQSNNGSITNVIATSSCGDMVPLGCYYDNGGEIGVQPTSDSCFKDPIGGGKIFTNGGCYVFVSTIFLSLVTDFKLLSEWTSRLLITFGACRNVFGHMFTNNWVNGTLYAFSIKNDVFYNSQNQASFNFCRDVVVLHAQTNNFYYRSSPWESTNGLFIGKPAPTTGSIFGPYDGNDRNLQYPTTVIDLGPRNNYMQELIMSDNYDGYVVNKLSPTTYSDVSELLNLFILTRMANTNFLQQLINGSSILSYFSRDNAMIDGDYAQAISVSSELGVAPFDAENYPPNPSGQDPIYINQINQSNNIFGVFFSSDTQLRDFISPKRTIISPNLSALNSCSFSNFSVLSQNVPFYQWDILTNNNGDSIFGSQTNEWHSEQITNGFFSSKYQSLDRISNTSRYFRTNNINQTQYFKGYIYSVDGAGNISGDISTWNYNNPKPRVVTAGSPYYFYFGLKKGKTAFDRFYQKWINADTTII